jgi:hypothetical protein
LQQQSEQQRREYLDTRERMREAEVLQVKRRPSLLSADAAYHHAQPGSVHHAQLEMER